MKSTVWKNSFIAITSIAVAALMLVGIAGLRSVRAEESTMTTQERREAAEAAVAEKKEAAKNRLADTQLKVCEKREAKIQNIMSRVSDRGQKHINLFTTIADRTQTFYAEKGRVLANYDKLVANVEAKKADAQEAVNATDLLGSEFSCDSDDPKAAAAEFRQSVSVRNDALKAYKTAVKDLIVGVKSVQGATSSGRNDTTTTEQTEATE